VIAGGKWGGGETDMLHRAPSGAPCGGGNLPLDCTDVSTLVETLSCAGCDPWKKLGKGYMDT